MNRSKKVAFITNVVLIAIFTVVFSVSLLVPPLIPSSGGKDVGAIYNGDRKSKKNFADFQRLRGRGNSGRNTRRIGRRGC